MEKLEMNPEQQLAFEGFIDDMVQIYKVTLDKVDYSKLKKNKVWVKGTATEETVS